MSGSWTFCSTQVSCRRRCTTCISPQHYPQQLHSIFPFPFCILLLFFPSSSSLSFPLSCSHPSPLNFPLFSSSSLSSVSSDYSYFLGAGLLPYLCLCGYSFPTVGTHCWSPLCNPSVSQLILMGNLLVMLLQQGTNELFIIIIIIIIIIIVSFTANIDNKT